MLLALAMLVLSFHVFLPLTHIYAGMSYDRFIRLQSTLLITHVIGILALVAFALIGAETANYVQVGVAIVVGAITWVLTRSQPDKSATWAFLLLGLFAIAGLTTQGIVIGVVIVGVGLLFPRLLQLGPENQVEEKPVFANTADTAIEAPSPFTYEGTTAVNDAFVTPTPVDEPSTRTRERKSSVVEPDEAYDDEPIAEEPLYVQDVPDASFDELLDTLNQPDNRFSDVPEEPAQEPDDFNALLDELNKPDPRFDEEQRINPQPDPTAFVQPPTVAEPDFDNEPTPVEDNDFPAWAPTEEPTWAPDESEQDRSQLFVEPDEDPFTPFESDTTDPSIFDTEAPISEQPHDVVEEPHDAANDSFTTPFNGEDPFISPFDSEPINEFEPVDQPIVAEQPTIESPHTYDTPADIDVPEPDAVIDEIVFEETTPAVDEVLGEEPVDEPIFDDETVTTDDLIAFDEPITSDEPFVEDPFLSIDQTFAEPSFPDVDEPSIEIVDEPTDLTDVQTTDVELVDETVDPEDVDDQASHRAAVVEGLLGIPGQSPVAEPVDNQEEESDNVDRIALFNEQTIEPSTRGRHRSTTHTTNPEDPSDALSEPVDDDMGTGGQRALSTRGRGGRHVRNPLAPIKSKWKARTEKEGDDAHMDKSIYTFRQRGQQLDVELDAPVVRQLAISDRLPTLAEPVLRDESINPWLAGEAYVVGESTDPWERSRDWHHMDRLPSATQSHIESLEAPPLGHGHYIHRLRQPTFFDVV